MSWGSRVPSTDAAASRKSNPIAVLTDVKKVVTSETIEFRCEDLESIVSVVCINSLSGVLAFLKQ